MSRKDSAVPAAPNPMRRGRIVKAILTIFLAPFLAITILPFALLARWLAKISKPIELPEGIPSGAEMKALAPHVGRGNADALRMWLRGAFFRELVAARGMTGTEAGLKAHELADLANVDGGFAVVMERGRG